MKDVPKAILALIVVGGILLFARNTLAGEWFPEAAIYADITTDSGDMYCYDSGHHASHLGARIDLYSDGPHTIRTMWVHNSCVQESVDKKTRDVIGIGYEYKLW